MISSNSCTACRDSLVKVRGGLGRGVLSRSRPIGISHASLAGRRVPSSLSILGLVHGHRSGKNCYPDMLTVVCREKGKHDRTESRHVRICMWHSGIYPFSTPLPPKPSAEPTFGLPIFSRRCRLSASLSGLRNLHYRRLIHIHRFVLRLLRNRRWQLFPSPNEELAHR